MDARPMAMSDALTVFENISDISWMELHRMGFDAWQALKHVRRMRDLGEAFTCFDDTTPLFIFGSYALDEGRRTTWFVGTERFFAMGARAVMYGRRFMQDQQKRYPGVAFESVTWSPHPDCTRWFELQGFDLVEDTGTFRRYLYAGN